MSDTTRGGAAASKFQPRLVQSERREEEPNTTVTTAYSRISQRLSPRSQAIKADEWVSFDEVAFVLTLGCSHVNNHNCV